MNDITFIGVNLTQELQKQLDSHKSAILSTAPPDAVKGYNLGVQNTTLRFTSLIFRTQRVPDQYYRFPLN